MTKLEAMAYKMQPAGHEGPAPRRNYPEPDRKLSLVFEKWQKFDCSKQFSKYENIVEDLIDLQKTGWNPSIQEAHSLLLRYQDQIKYSYTAGIFTSAVYNLQSENHIIFDIDLENRPSGLGYMLPRDKVLIALSPTDTDLGLYAKGIVVNYSTTGLDCGNWLNGLLINYGVAKGFDLSGGNRGGIIINLSTQIPANIPNLSYICYYIDFPNCENLDCEHLLFPDESGNWAQRSKRVTIDSRNGFIWKHLKKDSEKEFPELQDYLQKLKELLEPCKNDYKEAIKVFETCRQNDGISLEEKIHRDFENVFGACRSRGYYFL